MISSSRRSFIRGLAGVSLLSAGGCFSPHPRKPGQKVRLAAVGIMGKGYSDWTPMLKTGLVEMVAFCDADANMLTQALEKAKKDFPGLDLSKVPFYTDYRKLLDDAEKLGIDGSFRDGSAVDCEIFPALSRTVLMNDLRDILLSHTAFTRHEHSDVGRRNGNSDLKRTVQRRIVADDVIFVF